MTNNKANFGQGIELATLVLEAMRDAITKNKTDSLKIQEVIKNPGAIKSFFDKLFIPVLKDPLVSNVTIEKLDGKAVITEAKQVFYWIAGDSLKRRNLNKPGLATNAMLVAVKEVTSRNIDICNLLDYKRDVLSPAQVIYFCEKYPEHLGVIGDRTSFLIKMQNYFVVEVFVTPNGLHATVYRPDQELPPVITNDDGHIRIVTVEK